MSIKEVVSMDLTLEQKETLKEVWRIFRVRLVECVGTTRSRDESLYDKLNVIGINTLKLFNNLTNAENILIKDFIDFVINTVSSTKSLTKTIGEVDKVYKFSDFKKIYCNI